MYTVVLYSVRVTVCSALCDDALEKEVLAVEATSVRPALATVVAVAVGTELLTVTML